MDVTALNIYPLLEVAMIKSIKRSEALKIEKWQSYSATFQYLHIIVLQLDIFVSVF